MTVKFGIIGAGIMGMAGGKVLHLIPHAEISAIAEPQENRRTQAGKDFAINALYADYRQMLEKESLDAVYIATPDNFHRDPIIAS